MLRLVFCDAAQSSGGAGLPGGFSFPGSGGKELLGAGGFPFKGCRKGVSGQAGDASAGASAICARMAACSPSWAAVKRKAWAMM